MKRVSGILTVLLLAVFLQAGIEKKGSFDITEFAGEQSPVGITREVYKKGSFDLFARGGGGTGDVIIIG